LTLGFGEVLKVVELFVCVTTWFRVPVLGALLSSPEYTALSDRPAEAEPNAAVQVAMSVSLSGCALQSLMGVPALSNSTVPVGAMPLVPVTAAVKVVLPATVEGLTVDVREVVVGG
jgi:hypothetical protein